MSELRFAELAFAHGLWLAALCIALLWWLERRAGRALDRLVGTPLQGRLVARATPGGRRLRRALAALTLLFGVLALMRPQWGVEFAPARRAGAELMIALDVSRSMLAEDVAPSRLERAKAEIRDLLPLLDGDHVGLIAFAGRASVLCPMTPDFGFLRLVLDGAGPGSVRRGGTRLEEPIRKALAGFREEGDVSRVIVLITDGEDHDSFPLEAARAAAERGVAIIAIGFGSESGSEIPITDPRTGARSLLRDAEGAIVRSRLDGDTLREMALATGGVYVPAGTGVLDLESIYQRHIAGLVRGDLDERGRTVRADVFQWALLLALAALVASVFAGPPRAASAVALGLLLLVAPVRAQDAPSADAGGSETVPAPLEVASSLPPSEGAAPRAPRAAYNRALLALTEGALDAAQRDLDEARSRAGTDGELRFRALSALGHVAAARADALRSGDPQAALEALRAGADRFREALRLRPASDATRRNLEVLLRRARILADALREADPEALVARVDELLARQRAALAGARSAAEQARDPDSAPSRNALRQLSTEQRLILSDADRLAADADAERAELAALPEAERGPEEQMRRAQLEPFLGHLHRARERMGQARRELRRAGAGRAHRRSAAALGELKRARDALRNPLELLDALAGDAAEVLRETAALAALRSGDETRADAVPPWLDEAYLEERQQRVSERTDELHARLEAGLSQPPPAGDDGRPDPRVAALLEKVREAEPLVADARSAFADAGRALAPDSGPSLPRAVAEQGRGVQALLDARERFLDLRGLIEAAWREQTGIGSLLVGTSDSDEAAPESDAASGLAPERRVQLGRDLQARNRERGERIARELDAEAARLATAQASDESEREQRRVELARGLLTAARAGMEGVASALDPASAPAFALDAARPAQAQAHQALERLRRLYFTLIEHLRDTARRQRQLGDDTEAEAARADGAQFPPLAARQAELGERSGELAAALEAQSRQVPPPSDAAAAPGDAGVEQDTAQRLRRAGELVLDAQTHMDDARTALDGTPARVDDARDAQDDAFGRLVEAIALLEPPQQGQGPQDAGAQSGSPQASEGGQAAEAEPAPDPAQQLQAVRDRELERRRERDRAPSGSYETVEKDW